MHDQTLGWIAAKVVGAIRASEPLPEQAAYELGGMPFVDALRKEVRTNDKPQVLQLIKSLHWWERYLGTNISRPILDQEITELVNSLWQEEAHFHTKLAMIYLLLHAGMSSSEVEGVIAHLDSRKDEFLPCIYKFYDGHPGLTWGGLSERLQDKRFAGAQPIYLLSLALIAETDRASCGQLPPVVGVLAGSQDDLIRNLASRVQNSYN